MTPTTTRRNTIKLAGAGAAALLAAPAIGVDTAEANGINGKFIAKFAYPQATLAQNEALFREMNTNLITFGGRLRPYMDSDGIPWQVLQRVQGKRIFYYTEPATWDSRAAGAGHFYMNVNGTWWDAVFCWNNSVVITKNKGREKYYHAIDAGKRLGYHVYLGLPTVRMRTDRPGVADNSYLDVYESFCEKFVLNYHLRGVSGFYHTLEIALSDAISWWQPSWDVYWRAQRAIRHMCGHGKTVIFSPYLESRSHKAFKRPDQVAVACRKFFDILYGTNMIIAPQDGLGTGTTSLYADRKGGYVAKTEDYFKAMRNVLGHRLYHNVECMTPGGGTSSTRGTTTKSRVSQQLWTLRNHTTSAIGFMHNNKTGMRNIPGLGTSWTLGKWQPVR